MPNLWLYIPGGTWQLLLYLERDILSPGESPSSRERKLSGQMLRSNSTTTFNQSPINGIFSSPSMPNIPVALRGQEPIKTSSSMLVKKPYYEDSTAIHTQRNPLLVQDLGSHFFVHIFTEMFKKILKMCQNFQNFGKFSKKFSQN